MISRVRALAIGLGLAAAAAVLANAQDASPPDAPQRAPDAPPFEAFMTEEQLIEAFTDRTLDGCYTNGEPWAERTEANGDLYDLLRGDALVGEWWVEDRTLCYYYTGAAGHMPGTACWNVIQQNRDYFFFTEVEGELLGSTLCADLVAMLRLRKSRSGV